MDLISEIDEFIARTGMAPTAIGRAAFGNPHVVRRIKSGENITTRTISKLRAFMASYQAPEQSRAA
jgi:tRNA-dihydrouridine synthase